MPLRFGPRDLHLRAQRDGWNLTKEPKENSPLGGRRADSSSRMRRIVESIGDMAMNVEKEIDALRKKFFSAARAVIAPLCDPLTVGGTAVVAFSLTMMMREELMKAYQQYASDVAAKEGEIHQRHRALHDLLLGIQNDPFVLTEHGMLQLETRAFDAPERVVFVLNDIPMGELPPFFERLREAGLHVDRALYADPDAHEGFAVPHGNSETEKDPRSAVTIFQSTHDFRAVWNQTHWENEQLPYAYTQEAQQELTYNVLHRFAPAETPVPGMQGNVRVLYRHKKKDHEYRGNNSYLDRLRNGCEEYPWSAIVSVTYHQSRSPVPRPVPPVDVRFLAKSE